MAVHVREAEGISNIIRSIGTTGFGNILDRNLQSHIDFDMSCIFVFTFNDRPVLVHDGYSRTVSRKALEAYMRGGYLLDPFYVACVNEHPAGLWRMSELAPDSFFNSGFVIARDIHPCVSSEAGALVEEIGFIVPLKERTAAVYSLMRNQGKQPFSEPEIEALRSMAPVLSAAISSHHQQVIPAVNTSHEKEDIEATFLGVFQDTLTPTQRIVARLILRGHSNLSIARNMNISEGTAKIHRSNIYKRLSISSQSELFQLFIGYLTNEHH